MSAVLVSMHMNNMYTRQSAPMQAAHTQPISQAAARPAPGQVYRQPSQASHQGTLQGPRGPPPPPRTPTNRGILHHVSFQELSESQVLRLDLLHGTARDNMLPACGLRPAAVIGSRLSPVTAILPR